MPPPLRGIASIRYARCFGKENIMRLPLSGGCQCGAVRYEVAAEPMTVYACHCRDCQRQTGAAFALSMIVARDALSVTSGAPVDWLRSGAHTASGTPTHCMMCGACGSRLFNLPTRAPQLAILRPGTLDDISWLVPVGHIWTDSAQPWVRMPADTLNYPRQPPDNSALIEAWKNLEITRRPVRP
jgi:hypothetical protein